MTVYTDTSVDTPRSRGDTDAPHMTPVTPAEDLRTIMLNRVSWGAVCAGVAMALVVQLILNLLGIGIGAATIEPYADRVADVSLAATWWFIVAGIIAAYAGGFTAGRTAGEPSESTAGWHGLTSWAVSVIIIAFLVAVGAGMVIGGTLNNVGQPSPYSARSETGINGSNAGNTAVPPQNAPSDQATASPSPDEAQPLRRPVAQARAVMPQGALISAGALLLGALAAWFGGMAGAIKPTITNSRLRNRQPLH